MSLQAPEAADFYNLFLSLEGRSVEGVHLARNGNFYTIVSNRWLIYATLFEASIYIECNYVVDSSYNTIVPIFVNGSWEGKDGPWRKELITFLIDVECMTKTEMMKDALKIVQYLQEPKQKVKIRIEDVYEEIRDRI